MLAQSFEDRFLPDPMFKHLTGQFHIIEFASGPRKTRVIGASAHVVHDVAELVEVHLDFLVRHLEVFVFAKVRVHVSDRLLVTGSKVLMPDESSDRGLGARTIFVVQVQVELAHELASDFIVCVKAPLFFNNLAFIVFELQPQQLFVKVHRCVHNVLDGEVLFDLMLT